MHIINLERTPVSFGPGVFLFLGGNFMGLFDFLKKAQEEHELKAAERNEKIEAFNKKMEEKRKKLEEEKRFYETRMAENKAKLAAKKAQKTSNNFQKPIINDLPKDLTIPKPHVMNIKVAGVTFDNRQTILKKIYNKEKPFHQKLDVEFIGVDFNGELAIEIKINNQLIGYVERHRINEFVKHMNYGYKIKKIFPGYFEGENIYYCTIKVEFSK